MTNELLLNNIHLIRLAVERSLRYTGDMDLETYHELAELQLELEKQENLGDSP